MNKFDELLAPDMRFIEYEGSPESFSIVHELALDIFHSSITFCSLVRSVSVTDWTPFEDKDLSENEDM